MKLKFFHQNIAVAALFVLSIYIPDKAYCFDDQKTHPDLTYYAIKKSNLDTYLKSTLGVPEGIEKKYKDYTFLIFPIDKSITKLLQQGSTDEDDPTCRAANHFHDPLKAWTASYVTDSPAIIQAWCRDTAPVWPQYSNITWATGYKTRDEKLTASMDRQDMNWDNARSYLYSALTATAPADRDDYFVKTFRAVGQVLHLLQDMAVPAHVRNDFRSHLEFNGLKGNNPIKPISWFGNAFEYYVKLNPGLISASTPAVPVFLNQRVTDYWDTDQNGTVAGLAEFTNANYYSDETIPGNNPTQLHQYSSPQMPTIQCEDTLPGVVVKTTYRSRRACPTDGSKPDHFAALSLLNSEADINDNSKEKLYILDKNVHNTYAQELLPRAVGYSAGLLDYFFRGQLGAGLVSRMVTTDEVISGVKVKNQSTETMTSYTDPATGRAVGAIEIYYDAVISNGTATTTERRLLRSCPLSTTDCWQTAPLQLAPNQETGIISLPTPTGTTTTNPNQYTVVFRGQLGNEQGAVMAGKVNYWSEEWDGDNLKSNHIWRTLLEQNIFPLYDGREQFRYRTNEVVGGKLIQEHRSGTTSSNSSMASEAYDIQITDPHGYTGYPYCQGVIYQDDGSCEKYDFGPDFPIRVTPNTVVRIKVDEISITPPLEQDDRVCDFYHYSGENHSQGISMSFTNQHHMGIASLDFTVRGQASSGWPTEDGNVWLVPGQPLAVNVYQVLNYLGLPIQEPMYISAIDIHQSLSGSCPFERTQRMVVDYIRIEEQ